MHPASFSIKIFGIYGALTGIGLMLVPNLILGPLGIPPTGEIWIRVIGVLALVLGYYYWSCGVAGAVAFYQATVKGRVLFAMLCVALVAAFSAPVQILLFGAIDLAGAAWTWHGLRKPSGA